MRRTLSSLAALCALAAAAFGESPKAAPEAPNPTLSFVRGKEFSDKISALETLSAEYQPASGDGPSIWLIGVAHLGTTEYYAALQRRLDAQDAVLFEGVGAEKLTEGVKPDTSAGLQGQLARALGLVSQLDAIDYKRSHFINSDLTPENLNQALERRAEAVEAKETNAPDPKAESKDGEDKAQKPKMKVDTETFNQLMGALHGQGEMAESLSAMTTLMGSSPEMREMTKLTLIEALGQAVELIDLAKAMSPDIQNLFEVLITERNEHVVQQLKQQLARLGSGKSVAVFYGAAHMDEIAKRLTADLNYRRVSESWDTAFTADASKSLMPAAQIKAIIDLLRVQMQNGGGDGNLPDFPLFNFTPGGESGEKAGAGTQKQAK
jgi:hypothetical protein